MNLRAKWREWEFAANFPEPRSRRFGGCCANAWSSHAWEMNEQDLLLDCLRRLNRTAASYMLTKAGNQD